MSAWIEIYGYLDLVTQPRSVALYMSAWIEMRAEDTLGDTQACRTLYECVD